MTEDEMVGCHHWLNGHGLSKLQEMKDGEAWHAAVHGAWSLTKSQTQPRTNSTNNKNNTIYKNKLKID